MINIVIFIIQYKLFMYYNNKNKILTLNHESLLFEHDHLTIEFAELTLQHLLSFQCKDSTYITYLEISQI